MFTLKCFTITFNKGISNFLSAVRSVDSSWLHYAEMRSRILAALVKASMTSSLMIPLSCSFSIAQFRRSVRRLKLVRALWISEY